MLGTRAVERRILERSDVVCSFCSKIIKFQAMTKLTQIIANVYRGRGTKKRWDRVEHFHAECYREANEPYGPVVDTNVKQFAPQQ